MNGQLVLLHFDMAKLLGINAKCIRDVWKKNPARFPSDFAFRLNRQEFQALKNQNKIPGGYDGRSLPIAFTEAGIIMLSGFFYQKGQAEVFVNIGRACSQIYENRSYKQSLLKLKQTTFRHDRTVQKLFRLTCLLQTDYPPLGLNVQEIVSALKQLHHELS